MMRKMKTECCGCKKPIVVMVPKDYHGKGFTCNECVPADSAARDGINESIFTEYVPVLSRLACRLKFC